MLPFAPATVNDCVLRKLPRLAADSSPVRVILSFRRRLLRLLLWGLTERIGLRKKVESACEVVGGRGGPRRGGTSKLFKVIARVPDDVKDATFVNAPIFLDDRSRSFLPIAAADELEDLGTAVN